MGSGIGIAAGIGVAIAAQVAIISRASTDLRPLAVSLALQVSGVAAGVAWATAAGAWPDVYATARSWWWLPLGALGWGIVAALGLAGARLGVSVALAVVVAAQVAAGLAFDAAAGRIHLEPRHAAGVALLVAAVVLLTRRG